MAELKPPSLGRMRNVFSSRYGALWIAVFVNLILAVLYIWSRGGGVVHLRIESDGSRYTASVDGREIAAPTFNAAAEKSSVRFGILADDLVPSLPRPLGLEPVRIPASAAGAAVSAARFAGGPPSVSPAFGGELGDRHRAVTRTAAGGGAQTTGWGSWWARGRAARARQRAGTRRLCQSKSGAARTPYAARSQRSTRIIRGCSTIPLVIWCGNRMAAGWNSTARRP